MADVAVAVVEVTTDDVADIDPDVEGNGVDEVVRVIEASVNDEERGVVDMVEVTGPSSGVETAEVEAMEVVNTGEVELNKSKSSTWVKNERSRLGAHLQM